MWSSTPKLTLGQQLARRTKATQIARESILEEFTKVIHEQVVGLLNIHTNTRVSNKLTIDGDKLFGDEVSLKSKFNELLLQKRNPLIKDELTEAEKKTAIAKVIESLNAEGLQAKCSYHGLNFEITWSLEEPQNEETSTKKPTETSQ